MFSLIETRGLDIERQLQLEEALLRLDDRNICLINSGTKSPAIVLGISQKPHLVVNPTEIPLLRRFSGGGTVVVDEDTLFVTFIGNSDELQIAHNPSSVSRWTTKIYDPLFAGLNFSHHENDYRLGNRKIGGNAQYFCKKRFLHHTSFLFDWNQTRMMSLKMPPKMPSYRQNRPHESFLTPLKKYFTSKEQFMAQFKEKLSTVYGYQPLLLDEVEPLLNQPHRRSVTFINDHNR